MAGDEHATGVRVKSIITEDGGVVWTAETEIDGRLLMVLAGSEPLARTLLADRARAVHENAMASAPAMPRFLAY